MNEIGGKEKRESKRNRKWEFSWGKTLAGSDGSVLAGLEPASSI